MSMKVTREEFVGITYDELLEENAKLRELVVEMWRHKEALPYGLARYVLDKMEELGIEVE